MKFVKSELEYNCAQPSESRDRIGTVPISIGVTIGFGSEYLVGNLG
jgi:hypothetical protein